MKDKRICIYGLGDYGLETYFRLKQNNIKIDYFADRSAEKQGYALDGLYCISYERLLQKDKENSLVIVAIKNPEKLIHSFALTGFQHVYDRETAYEILQREVTGDNGVARYDSVKDMAAIERMKAGVQNAVYYGKKSDSGNLILQGILLDYFRRNVDRKGYKDIGGM